jgi:ATPase components of ABC transporters with duplicated ATPase domains
VAQNQAQRKEESRTVCDTIDRVAVGDIRLKIRDILGAVMFGGEASDKKVKVLSGGERYPACHDKTAVGAGEFPDSRRTYGSS